jgi:peptidoglycan/LPS O-acetylase OafA/YrhL
VLYTLNLVLVSDPGKYTWNALPPNILMMHAWGFTSHLTFNYPSWSISAEMFVYAVFPFLLLLTYLRGSLGVVALFLLLLVCTSLSEIVLASPLSDLTYDFSFIRALPSFTLGIFLYKFSNTYKGKIPGALISGIFHGLLMLVIVAMSLQLNKYIILGIIYVFCFTAVICDKQNIETVTSARPVAWLGRLTYSTYMLHPVVGTVFASFLFPRLFGTSMHGRLITVALALIITFVVSYMSYRYFETPLRMCINGQKLPVLHWRLVLAKLMVAPNSRRKLKAIFWDR